MEPSKKSSGLNEFLENFAGRTSSIMEDKCLSPPIGCGKPIGKFRDALSQKEYRISGLCQECQDSVFGQ